ncbi:hypothetical protein SAMD00079811_57000 [Scytonema sp. HK-05]|uniref:hypothetical protein n=1 Tax=Scytonema sp. HK-05 TaxID=1137095 RepID=UPI0009375CB5|nr:hypothetical protein [Scytonema sp. HK-05]OKH57754.1 hypothetical protein NIES2130_17945 [Scytonema sp. HK-05]BAY48081.1 hypothetical protein SAMD00079811_57000 [Scytonema sp. HK-05]
MSKTYSICGTLLIIFFCLPFALMPFSLIWEIGGKDVLTCNHLPSRQTICQHQSWRLFGSQYQVTEWQLQGARVVEDNAMGAATYGFSLATNNREVAWPYSSNHEQAYQDVAKLHELLEGSLRPSLQLKDSRDWLENLLMFVIGALLILDFWVLGPLWLIFEFPRSFIQSI